MAGVGSVPVIPAAGAGPGVVAGAPVVDEAPIGPPTFGFADELGFIVIAPAGALVAGAGALEPALGVGGDCVLPWAKAEPADSVRAKASAYFIMMSSSWTT